MQKKAPAQKAAAPVKKVEAPAKKTASPVKKEMAPKNSPKKADVKAPVAPPKNSKAQPSKNSPVKAGNKAAAPEEEKKADLTAAKAKAEPAKIETILTQAPEKIKEIWERNKIPLIIDKSGNFNTFLKYKGSMADYTEFSLLEKMGKKTKEAFIEEFRMLMVASMRNGHTMCLFFDKSIFDVRSFFKDVPYFVIPDILTPKQLQNKDFYKKKVLLPEEDKDVQGNVGYFEIRDDFNFIFLFHADDAVEIQKTINLPSELFEVLVIKEN